MFIFGSKLRFFKGNANADPARYRANASKKAPDLRTDEKSTCFVKNTKYKNTTHIKSPIHYFSELTDPRVDSTKEHLMMDIIFITSKEESETRLYITSSEASAEVIGKGVRSHWGIENKLHWQLAVSFSEDQSRKRDGYAAQNFFLLNRIAFNLLKNEQSPKRSAKGKRLDAGWNTPKMPIRV